MTSAKYLWLLNHSLHADFNLPPAVGKLFDSSRPRGFCARWKHTVSAERATLTLTWTWHLPFSPWTVSSFPVIPPHTLSYRPQRMLGVNLAYSNSKCDCAATCPTSNALAFLSLVIEMTIRTSPPSLHLLLKSCFDLKSKVMQRRHLQGSGHLYNLFTNHNFQDIQDK